MHTGALDLLDRFVKEQKAEIMRYPEQYSGHGDDYSRFGGATTQLPQFSESNYSPAAYNVPQAPPNPPKYSEVVGAEQEAQRPWYNPRGWSGRKKLIVAAIIAVLIIVIIVGAYEGWKVNRYPDYSKINYSLADTYSGEGFFQNFEYYSTWDTTGGFVQYVNLLGAIDQG